MINRLGEVVPCLVTARMQYGDQHNIQAVRFTPLTHLGNRLTEQPSPTLPLPLSRHTSFVPIAQPPPLNAAPPPPLPSPMMNQDTWAQLGLSPSPPPPSHDLLAALLGGSNEAEPLPFQDLQPPMTPSSAVAGPRASLSPATASGPPALSPHAGGGIDVALNEEEMQLLLEAIDWPVDGEGWEESGTDRGSE